MGRLTQYDREQIELYFRQGLSDRKIAKRIGKLRVNSARRSIRTNAKIALTALEIEAIFATLKVE